MTADAVLSLDLELGALRNSLRTELKVTKSKLFKSR